MVAYKLDHALSIVGRLKEKAMDQEYTDLLFVEEVLQSFYTCVLDEWISEWEKRDPAFKEELLKAESRRKETHEGEYPDV